MNIFLGVSFFICFVYIFLNKQCEIKTTLTHKSSQFNQDLLLYYYFFQNKRNGYFIELGAFDGIRISNTIFFEKSLNWHGILIEGEEKNCKYLKQNSKVRRNSIIICSPICKGEYVSYSGKGYFGKVNYNYSLNSKLSKCNTLRNITKYYNIKHIDILSLDVEGSELEVLETFDFSVTVSHLLIEWNHLSMEVKSNITLLLNNNGYYFDKTRVSPIDVIFSKNML